jgi:hypothetical protein
MPSIARQVENLQRANKMRPAATPSIERSTGRSTAELPLEQWEHKLDQEWQGRLKCLEQWLSKLLVKNEQLRMSLVLATAQGDTEAESVAAGNRSHARTVQIDEP